jgi:hypothetical protein
MSTEIEASGIDNSEISLPGQYRSATMKLLEKAVMHDAANLGKSASPSSF